MKRGILITGIILILLILFFYVGLGDKITGKIIQTKKATCMESDKGIDYFNKGSSYFSDKSANHTDYCEGDITLVEGYCEKYNGEEYISLERYKCPEGCEDGACININIPEKEDEAIQPPEKNVPIGTLGESKGGFFSGIINFFKKSFQK